MTDKADSSLARMLSVLDLFSDQRLHWNAEDISEALGVSLPTSYRYVKTLSDAGLLRRGPDAQFTLGPRIVVLDHYIRQADPVLQRGIPFMRELVKQTGFDCVVSSLYGDQLLDTHREHGSMPADLSYGRGRPRPLFLGGAAKLPRKWLDFLKAVNEAYHQNDQDRAMVSMTRDWTAGIVSAEGEFSLEDLGADLIADVTAHAIRQALQKPALSGLYHLVASGETSWHGYASHAIAQARQLKPDADWKVTEIAPVPTSAFPTPARRPLNSRLNTQRLQQAFGLTLPAWQNGVDRLLAEGIETREQLQVVRALELIRLKAVAALKRLSDVAAGDRDTVLAARTHNVAAQATTVPRSARSTAPARRARPRPAALRPHRASAARRACALRALGASRAGARAWCRSSRR